MRDLDKDLLRAAVKKGLIQAEDRDRIERLVAESQGKLYGAQVLVRERMISCQDLLKLQNALAASVYECPHCKQRHTKKDLPKTKGASFKCKSCDAKILLNQARASLSRVEVLSSRDPLDLTITLQSDTEASSGSAGSSVSEMDLDRYEVYEELGRGGYGVVFKAHQKDLQRDCALKVLRGGQQLPEVALERFIREGRSASRLKHPNIVQVYDIGRHRDLFAMSMELVPGDSLRDILKARGAIPWAETLELMEGVLQGVAHAHEQGIVHRDLKPNNIIIESDSKRPRIIDFGLAKNLHQDSALTGAGAIIGTPYYLSPEQIEGRSSEADTRSDVFSLGVILYQMLSGKRPFAAKLKNEVYRLILHEEPKPLSELVYDLPDGLAAVAEKAMAKSPDDRFADAGSMRGAILPFLDDDRLENSVTSGTGRRRSSSRKVKRATDRTKTARDTGKTRRKSGAGRVRPGPGASAPGGGPGLVVAGVVGALLVVGLGGFMLGQDGASSVAERPTQTPSPTASARPASSTRPSPTPSPSRTPEREPTREPDVDPETPRADDPEQVSQVPDVEETPSPPEPEESPAAVVETPPEQPSPDPSPEPEVVQLDDGKRDKEEFPSLAKQDRKKWLERAFFINAVASESPTPRRVRALRFALGDRKLLNRAFALRGLVKWPADFVRAHGSQALFEALVDQLNAGEPYVERTSLTLLIRLANGKKIKSKSKWKKWWREEGSELFLESARHPPDVEIPTPKQSVADDEQLRSQSRNTTNYMSQVREQGLDIFFVLDVTNSMNEELDRMRTQVKEITSFMDLLLKKKVRMGYVTYGSAVRNLVPLTNKLDRFAREVEQGVKLEVDPSNTTVPEAVSLGLAAALDTKRVGWKPKAVHSIMLLGDAPPQDPKTARELAEQAKANGFTIHTLIAKTPYPNFPAKPIFEELAKTTGGMSVEVDNPEELITRILVIALGSKIEADLRRFVYAYREVTGLANLPD